MKRLIRAAEVWIWADAAIKVVSLILMGLTAAAAWAVLKYIVMILRLQ
jgi:hypothetical protein